MHDADTISGISSPIGEGGIGILRMSGPHARAILASIFRPRTRSSSFESHRLALGVITDPETGADVDEVFAVFMGGPRTYTREDMAEIYSHGGLACQRKILSLMVRQGTRLAGPGEFTKRAFLNGRIDLAQAESVLDIIQSETDEELACAMAALKGAFSRRIDAIKDRVTTVLAEIEATIDFPEEKLDLDPLATLAPLAGARDELAELVATYTEGRAVKSGVEVLIVGRANVGKSSLLNALLMEERAIVTPLPGTTRDLIEDTLHMRGIKVRIIDTAGLRQPRDAVEHEGIARARSRIPQADVVLWVLDASEPYSDEDEHIRELLQGKQVVVALNKTDLPQRLDHGAIASRGIGHVPVSALKGSGLETLKDALYEMIAGKGFRSGCILVTNLRHRDALAATHEAIARALAVAGRKEPLEFVAFEVREALSHLGEITGETCPEEILDLIFSRFCIGK
jgi:tRNA modification GTPase